MQPHNQLLWADNFRAFATVCVVILHVAAPILYKFGTVSDYVWWVGNIVDSTVRFCVPAFLMLSGALLLGKDYALGDFIKKRFTRILYPFLFWSVVYIATNLIHRFNSGASMSYAEIGHYIFILFKKKPSYHLWFVYMILGIYLFMPIISKWIRNTDEKGILYFLSIWFATTVIGLPVVAQYMPEIDLKYFAGYMGFPVLGYYLSTKQFNFNIKPIAIVLFFLGVSVTAVGTYYLSALHGKFYGTLYAYLTPNIIIASAAMFLLFKPIEVNNRFLKHLVEIISTYSFGIYLAHVLVLTFLSEMKINWSFINPFVGITVTTVLCLVISTALVYAINKLPFIGKHVSG